MSYSSSLKAICSRFTLVLFPFCSFERNRAGGLADEVDVDILKAAFVPFGDVKDVQIPPDPQNAGVVDDERQKVKRGVTLFPQLHVACGISSFPFSRTAPRLRLCRVCQCG